MGSFGERMQREREMRGITLEEIAESTKIGTRSLRALEEEDFDKLPGGIFNKGFVRAYAKYLGIDEEQAVTDFMAAFGDFQQQLPAPPQPQALPDEQPGPNPWSAIALIAGVLVLIVLGGAWYFNEPIRSAGSRVIHRFRKSSGTPAASPVSASAPAVVEAAKPGPAMDGPPATATAPNQSVVAPQSSPQPAAVAGEFVVQFHARLESWVSITADDRVLMEGTLKGDRTVRAKDKVVFKTGNAGAVEVSFNGEVQPPLGGDNQVKTIVFTAAGMQR